MSDFDWLIRMMVNVVCRGGNWLVNIGPDKNGKVSEEIKTRIHEVGEWLRAYGESIYETTAGPYEPVDGVYGSTFRGDTVYLHILDTDAFEKVLLPEIGNEIMEAALYDGRPVGIFRDDGIRLALPDVMQGPDTIVVLKMKDMVCRETEEIHFTGKE